MRWLLLSAWFAPFAGSLGAQTTADHPAIIIAPYDAEQDRTILQVLPFRIDSTLGLSALTALIGREPATHSNGGVVLTLWNTGTTAFESPPVRIRLADGTDIDLGKAWSTPTPAPGYTEVMLVAISLDQFRNLAASPTAVLHVGDRAILLSASHLNALRDLASRLRSVTTQ